jgi:hypothetical protein
MLSTSVLGMTVRLTSLRILRPVLQSPNERPFDLGVVLNDVHAQQQVEKKAPTIRDNKAAKDATQKAALCSGVSNTFGAYGKSLNP